VIDYVREAHPEIAPLVGSPDWGELSEPRIHALAVFGFDTDTWRMNMTVLPADVVAVEGEVLKEDTYDVELRYIAPPPYILWQGMYAPSAGVTEDAFIHREIEVEAIAPEVARDIAFQYIQEAHPEVDEPHEAWSQPQVSGGTGRTRYSYAAGDWRIEVYWSDYTATYEVHADYKYVGSHTVQIEWTAAVSADGEETTELYFDYFGGV